MLYISGYNRDESVTVVPGTPLSGGTATCLPLQLMWLDESYHPAHHHRTFVKFVSKTLLAPQLPFLLQRSPNSDKRSTGDQPTPDGIQSPPLIKDPANMRLILDSLRRGVLQAFVCWKHSGKGERNKAGHEEACAEVHPPRR